jgi:hypothetical protein
MPDPGTYCLPKGEFALLHQASWGCHTYLYGVVVFNLAQHETGLERTRLRETSVKMFIDSLGIRRHQLRIAKYLYVLSNELKSLPEYESMFADVLKGIDESVNLSDIILGSKYLLY